MCPPIFVGDIELNEAHSRVGMIVGACARLEGAIAYLEWQLKAFSWDAENPAASPADRQTALLSERVRWNKYARLNKRLKLVTEAFAANPVSSRISQDQRLQEMHRQWACLCDRARHLAEKRNEIGHTYLGWRNNMVTREISRPWNDQVPVSEAEDEALMSKIGALAVEIGRYSTELGKLLPFADQDQINTI